MSLLSVKAKAGRVAYDRPKHGNLIPTDHYVSVEDTPYIRRLLNYHEDIELQPAEKEKPAAKTAAVADPAPAPIAADPAPASAKK